jgi:predicted hotdog family 3-hydroxylacyl-ACP dehydratase
MEALLANATTGVVSTDADGRIVTLNPAALRLLEGGGEPPRMGFLLGGRRITFHVARFRRGDRLRVEARRVWGGPGGLASFDCSLEDAATGKLLAEGRLNCAVAKAGEEFGGVT